MIPTIRVSAGAGLSFVAGMGLVGCVSTTSAEVSEQVAVATDAARSPQCDLLTAEYLRSELATSFRDGRPLHGSTENRTECQWATENRIALVKTVVDQDGRSYADTRRQSQRSLGMVTDVKIGRAERAFQVPGYGLTGMLIKGKYVQVVVAVPTAGAEEIRDIAESVAAKVAKRD